MKSSEQNYVTETLSEHHRILREGNRFKREIKKVQSVIDKFIFDVIIKHKQETKGKQSKKKKKKKRSLHTTPIDEKNKPKDKNTKAEKRFAKLKAGGRKQLSLTETDAMLKDCLKRLCSWSERCYDIMDRQMRDITKLYIATLDYNVQLNASWVSVPE